MFHDQGEKEMGKDDPDGHVWDLRDDHEPVRISALLTLLIESNR